MFIYTTVLKIGEKQSKNFWCSHVVKSLNFLKVLRRLSLKASNASKHNMHSKAEASNHFFIHI